MFITKSFLHVLKVRNPVSPRERPEMEYTMKVDPDFQISARCRRFAMEKQVCFWKDILIAACLGSRASYLDKFVKIC